MTSEMFPTTTAVARYALTSLPGGCFVGPVQLLEQLLSLGHCT